MRINLLYLVRLAGIEPVRVSSLDPKSSASASSAIGAALLFNNNYLLRASYFISLLYMKKIVFVCHGNICRSVAAEYIMKSMTNNYIIVSRATSYEEIGNDIYPPMKRVLNEHGVRYERHFAAQITHDEYLTAEYIFYMDTHNLYYLERMFGRNDKYVLITRFLDDKTIEDPWYTGRFEFVYKRIESAIKSIVDFLKDEE